MKRTDGITEQPYKEQVGLAAVKSHKTLAQQFRVNPTWGTEWEQHLLALATDMFARYRPLADTLDLKTRHTKFRQLTLMHNC